eukprot:2601401-Rhodomonas_salina.2
MLRQYRALHSSLAAHLHLLQTLHLRLVPAHPLSVPDIAQNCTETAPRTLPAAESNAKQPPPRYTLYQDGGRLALKSPERRGCTLTLSRGSFWLSICDFSAGSIAYAPLVPAFA